MIRDRAAYRAAIRRAYWWPDGTPRVSRGCVARDEDGAIRVFVLVGRDHSWMHRHVWTDSAEAWAFVARLSEAVQGRPERLNRAHWIVRPAGGPTRPSRAPSRSPQENRAP